MPLEVLCPNCKQRLSIGDDLVGKSVKGPCGHTFHFFGQTLHEKLEKHLKEVLQPNEKVFLKLQGAFKEGLICTDTRVLVLKTGYFTGNMFGANCFQLPYGSIAGVETKYNLLSGYFEISAGGMQNQVKSYWSNDPNKDPTKAVNCVSLNSKDQAARFKAACGLIMLKISERNSVPTAQTPAPTTSSADLLATVERLAEMQAKGLITQEEFLAKKTSLLARL